MNFIQFDLVLFYDGRRIDKGGFWSVVLFEYMFIMMGLKGVFFRILQDGLLGFSLDL